MCSCRTGGSIRRKWGTSSLSGCRESFANLMDYGFTARLEEELDEIAAGEIDWKTVLNEFYRRFSQQLEHAES